MRARPFLIGLAAGILLTAVLGVLFVPFRGPARLGGARTGSSDAQTTDDDLRAELDRLRAELAELRRQPDRRPVDATDAAGGDPGAVDAVAVSADAVDDKPKPADLPALLAELELQLRSGALAQRFADSPDQLRAFLIQNWLQVDQPAQALALLRGVEPPSDILGYARSIGDALRQKGDPALAGQAYLMALGQNPEDWDVIQRLMEMAPGAALAQLQAMPANGELGAEARAQRALLLIASGDRDAGLAAFDALVAAGDVSPTAYHFLVQRDPAAAETRLRTYLESHTEDNQWYQLELADAIKAQGRTSDAIAQVESLLQQQPDNYNALQKLGEFDRGKALQYLQNRLATDPSADAYGAYGEQLLAAGRREDALAAYWQAWEMQPGSYAAQLLNLAPERFAPQLIQQAGANNDDELFGDIADALWRAGQHDRARSLWQRAHDIDSGDSEWIGKLARVARGTDPFR